MARLAFALSFACGALAGCSLIVDKGETQCSTDSDCEHFGGHPYCQQGVCVDSGLGPPGCFFGTPSDGSDFADQCTVSQTFQYDNCKNLQLCDATSLSNAMSVGSAPGSANSGKVAAPQNPEPTPTILCSDLPSMGIATNVMYITGSTNLPPLVKAVQPLLYAQSPSYVAVFDPQTSCAGAASIYVGGSASILLDVANSYAFYYDTSGNQQFCSLGSAGEPVDVGESDVYPSTCSTTYTSSSIADYTGPVQAITFVVPSGSTQRSISAEAAHLVFAAGGNSVVMPWNVPLYYFVRSSGTGTIQLPSKEIATMPTAWWGFDRLSAGNLVESMEATPPANAESAIGVLSNDFADRSRANLTVLAFQQQGQIYGYLPDSSSTSLDKMNVRDGHYPIWGQIHLLASVSGGQPSQAAAALVTQFTVPKLDQTLVTAIIQSGFTPTCAMQVSHTAEVGALSVYQPPFGCSCYFDATTGSTLPSECATCGADLPQCPSTRPACNYGYCEVQ
ncbi:MAG TPA: hypothetical protein VGG28_33415 [Kofleriaceae bacterium]|jgi:hypothetical protein